jgi:hypothetical protein
MGQGKEGGRQGERDTHRLALRSRKTELWRQESSVVGEEAAMMEAAVASDTDGK